MIVNRALRVRGAWVLQAGALALVVDASLVGGAIAVAPAAQNDTGDTWIPTETRWTGALSVVIDADAFGSLAADH